MATDTSQPGAFLKEAGRKRLRHRQEKTTALCPNLPDDHAPDPQLVPGGLIGLVEEWTGNAIVASWSASWRQINEIKECSRVKLTFQYNNPKTTPRS
jgi:hypothetical protein